MKVEFPGPFNFICVRVHDADIGRMSQSIHGIAEDNAQDDSNIPSFVGEDQDGCFLPSFIYLC